MRENDSSRHKQKRKQRKIKTESDSDNGTDYDADLTDDDETDEDDEEPKHEVMTEKELDEFLVNLIKNHGIKTIYQSLKSKKKEQRSKTKTIYFR